MVFECVIKNCFNTCLVKLKIHPIQYSVDIVVGRGVNTTFKRLIFAFFVSFNNDYQLYNPSLVQKTR